MSTDNEHRMPLAPVLIFLAITFVVTYVLQFLLIRDGVGLHGDVIRHTPTVWLFAIMWGPGAVALFVTAVIEKVPFKELPAILALRMGPLRPYLLMFVLAPLAFVVMYGLSWGLGLTTPDMTFSSLAQVVGGSEAISAEDVFKMMLPLSLIVGPLIQFAFCLGEEIGWRGYLLPRLMGLGKVKAYTILGILWGLWHAPIIWVGFNYPGHPVAGIGMMCALTSAFGLFINEMTLHYRSTILAGFIHGAVNAQGFGIWMWLFPGTNPLLGGGTGLTAVAVWLVIGLVTMKILAKIPNHNPLQVAENGMTKS